MLGIASVLAICLTSLLIVFGRKNGIIITFGIIIEVVFVTLLIRVIHSTTSTRIQNNRSRLNENRGEAQLNELAIDVNTNEPSPTNQLSSTNAAILVSQNTHPVDRALLLRHKGGVEEHCELEALNLYSLIEGLSDVSQSNVFVDKHFCISCIKRINFKLHNK